jgi:hypothetical protein
LAPQIFSHEWICVVGELFLPVFGDCAVVDLIALSIIEMAGGQEDSSPVSTRPIGIPNVVDSKVGVVI